MIRWMLVLPILLSACLKDETISGFTDADVEWQLVELNKVPFSARATINFPGQGRIAGQAPCNRYFGVQTVPYPWFQAQSIGATKMACADLNQEHIYFASLRAMTLIEVSGDTLNLSNDADQTMVFQALE